MTWEQKLVRWTIKGVVWAFAYIVATVSLGLEPSWKLIVLIVICGITNDILDKLLPTDSEAR